MTVIRRIAQPAARRVYISANIAGVDFGYQPLESLNIFQKGEILLVTKLTSYKGFTWVCSVSSVAQQRGSLVILPADWYRDNCESGFVQTFYTKHGVFLKAVPDNFGEGFLNPNPAISRKNKKELEAESIISHLNDRRKQINSSSRGYRVMDKNHQKHIKARMKEGYTYNDFILVINYKCRQWRDPKWSKYLRPSTLFSSTHFGEYLAEAESDKPAVSDRMELMG